MALVKTSLTDLQRIEDNLAEVASDLRKLRNLWEEKHKGDLQTEFEKASKFVEYLHGTWIERFTMQVRKSLKDIQRETSVEAARSKKAGR